MPRPRTPLDIAGTAIGGAVGAAAAGPAGAAVGAMLGSLFNWGNEPVPLRESVARACRERDLELTVFRRDSLYEVTVIFQRPANSFWKVETRVAPRQDQTRVQIDDDLYDAVVEELDRWVTRHVP